MHSRWSRAISKFRAMNAGLGNRDSYRTADIVCHDGGRVLQCPLCFSGSNDEFHLLIKCRTMQKHREDIKLRNGLSLQAFLIDLQSTSSDELTAARAFLGQNQSLNQVELVDRGYALDILVERFFLEWSSLIGRQVTRPYQHYL